MAIRKRGDRYQVRVGVGHGQRIERTLPEGATRSDARALEDALKRRHIDTAAGRRPDRLIDEAIAEWLPAARQLKSWDKDLRYRVAVLQEAHTPGKRLSDIPEVARGIVKTGLSAELSPAAINRYLAILRRVANLALKWGWTDVPYGRRIELLPGERQRDAHLSPEQVLALAEAAGGPAGDAIMLAALTGLRRGELMGLRPDQVRNGVVVLDSNTKSGKPRIVPLVPQAVELVARCLPWTIGPLQVRNAFQQAREAVGLPHVRFHDCRHAFGSWLAASGAHATAIRDMMGHSSLTVTSRYLHTEVERLQASVAGLPRLARKS